MGLVHDFGGMVTARLFLGLTEAGMFLRSLSGSDLANFLCLQVSFQEYVKHWACELH
jgi:hypothetical protein